MNIRITADFIKSSYKSFVNYYKVLAKFWEFRSTSSGTREKFRTRPFSPARTSRARANLTQAVQIEMVLFSHSNALVVRAVRSPSPQARDHKARKNGLVPTMLREQDIDGAESRLPQFDDRTDCHVLSSHVDDGRATQHAVPPSGWDLQSVWPRQRAVRAAARGRTLVSLTVDRDLIPLGEVGTAARGTRSTSPLAALGRARSSSRD